MTARSPKFHMSKAYFALYKFNHINCIGIQFLNFNNHPDHSTTFHNELEEVIPQTMTRVILGIFGKHATFRKFASATGNLRYQHTNFIAITRSRSDVSPFTQNPSLTSRLKDIAFVSYLLLFLFSTLISDVASPETPDLPSLSSKLINMI